MVTVRLPEDLRDLTEGARTLEVDARDLHELVAALDRAHPGMALRLQAGYGAAVDGTLHDFHASVRLNADSQVRIVAAISGG